MKEDRLFVTALARGIEVLRCFTPERPELGTTEIAVMTGLPQSTIWRLCHTLSALGCLVTGHNPQKLRVGVGALTLGQASLTHAGLAEAALPAMKELANRFGGSISLATRDRLHMVIVQRAEAPTILRLHLHVGSALAIEQSALGWAYYAASGPAEREEILQSVSRATRDSVAALRARLAQVVAEYQRNGYVLNLRSYHPEVNAIGVAIVGAGGRRVMALNCGGGSTVMTRKLLTGSIAKPLQSLAEKLSGLLTFEP